MNNVKERLKEIQIEDYIWLIYLFIILLSYISNDLEKKYLLMGDLISKKKYRKIMIFIFTILIIVYFYFLYSSFNDLKNIKLTTSRKEKILYFSSYIASLLIFISGVLFLLIAINDENLNVELAFN